MAKVKDLTGKRFKKIKVLKFIETREKSCHAYYLCKCDCGLIKEVRGSHLLNGNTKSCGCLSAENGAKFLKKYTKSTLHKGKNNPAWKGDNVKYSTIHCWLSNNYTKDICAFCGSKNNLDWALKKKYRHKKNRKNYLVLCRKCHIHYDKC